MDDSEMVCVCGDLGSEHVGGSEQCFVIGCGCSWFEELGDEEY